MLKLKIIYKNPLSKLLVLPVHKYRNTVGLIIGSQPLPLLVRVDLIESLQWYRVIRLTGLDGGSGVLAVGGRTLGDGLGLAARLGSLEFLADGLDAGSAGAGDGSSSAEVRVDASKDLSRVGLYVLDDNAARDRVLAVTASTVELAEVNDSEAIDGNSSLSVLRPVLVFVFPDAESNYSHAERPCRKRSGHLHPWQVRCRLLWWIGRPRRHRPTYKTCKFSGRAWLNTFWTLTKRSRWCKDPRSEHPRSGPYQWWRSWGYRRPEWWKQHRRHHPRPGRCTSLQPNRQPTTSSFYRNRIISSIPPRPYVFMPPSKVPETTWGFL